ncbi:MAG TPA: alpha/beta hydrolase, partial [Casimicrobiaceae bacterium]|nr:alpha/beta hydrolase [Casimicrobiaceae bacterium]
MTTLDPEAQVVIDSIKRAKTPALSTCTIQDARRIYAKGLRMLDIAPDKSVVTEDRKLAASTTSVAVRMYRPPEHASLAGRVLLWFHGGGYCVGSLETTDIACRMFAS